jgi:hypothetical protein
MPDNDRKLKREARRRQKEWKKRSKAKGVDKPRRTNITSCGKGRTRRKRCRVGKGKVGTFIEEFKNKRTIKKSDSSKASSISAKKETYSSKSKNPRFL